MSSSDRGGLLATIWFSMALVAIGIAVGSSSPALLAVPISVALIMTIALVLVPDVVAVLTAQREKAKREPQDRLSMLLELMDEDERAAFKESLKRRVLDDIGRTDDGELPADDATLAALLDEEQAQKRTHR